MRITELSVQRWQLTVLGFLMLVTLGVSSWLTIPRAEDPTFPAPIYTVVAVYPGAGPTDLEQLVVDPVEEKLRGLDRVKKVTASARDGLATITVEFDPSVDADRKFDEVQREVNALRPTLPADLRSVTVEKYSSAEVNILQVALVSDVAPFVQMEQLAKKLEDRISAVSGVRDTQVWGYPEREVKVALDLGRLAQTGIPAGRVLQAIAADAGNIPGGSVDLGARRMNVKTHGAYESVEQVRQTVVGAAGGQLARLRDVAEVEWGYADPGHDARLDGHRAVWITATQQVGVNVERVRDAAWREMDAFEKTLPASITLRRPFDQAQNVRTRLGRLTEDFSIAILLVLLTLVPLGWRAAVIVMISIPLSLAVGVTLLSLTGFSINQLSIVGAVIALGLLVDDSIVVVENISRFRREGHGRVDAAILGVKQISTAVLGCTAALILAFVPLLFLPGLPGRYIRSLPATVIFTVLASLLVSLTIVPWLASRILPSTVDAHGNRALRLFERVIHVTYAPILDRALRHPWRALALAGALIVASVALVPSIGFSLFPKAGTPQFLVRIETPEGSSLAETDRAARFAERVLMARPEVKSVLANVGRDNPQIYYNVIPRGLTSNAAQLFVLLREYREGRTERVLDTLRAQLDAYPGARIELREFENGPPIEAPIALRIQGDDLGVLRRLAGDVERVLSATPGTQYVGNPVRIDRSDLRVDLDRQKAGLLGVSTLDVDRAVRLAIGGIPAGLLRTADGNDHDVVVRLPNGGRPSVDALDRVWVASASGAQVPLRQLAAVRFESAPAVIQHRDGERAITVTSFVRGGWNTARVTDDALSRLRDLDLPLGYRIVPAGELESREESFGGMGGAVIVAVFLILAVLVLEFRTFRTTFVVASVIPLGVVGGLIALFLTGYTLSFTAMIGFVALVGIEIKTSILLVDLTNQLHDQGMPMEAAIRRAGEVRFLPIVLTSLTAIGGLLPLAVQRSPLYSPLAWVIIGGLLSSTLLARIVTPVLYSLATRRLRTEPTGAVATAVAA
ncbi:MAG: efflux RND transporter permease subunit [Gemmatimonadaceae bacterium]